jgi:trehalose 2-sulfotransferase
MQIDHLLTVIHEHNRAWHEWFAEAGITPHTVRYEDLDRDPIGTAAAALADLGLEAFHSGALEVRHRRLADHLNIEWIELYRSYK